MSLLPQAFIYVWIVFPLQVPQFRSTLLVMFVKSKVYTDFTLQPHFIPRTQPNSLDDDWVVWVQAEPGEPSDGRIYSVFIQTSYCVSRLFFHRLIPGNNISMEKQRTSWIAEHTRDTGYTARAACKAKSAFKDDAEHKSNKFYLIFALVRSLCSSCNRFIYYCVLSKSFPFSCVCDKCEIISARASA